jgi:hypothetical protein
MSIKHLAAATAIGAVGFLTVPVPAHATPTFPLTPAGRCIFKTASQVLVWQGFDVNLNASALTTISGDATYFEAGHTDSFYTKGTVSGGIDGTRFDAWAIWDSGAGAGTTNHFEGQVNDDGSASGIAYSSLGDSAARRWVTKSNNGIVCEEAAAAPAPAAAPTAATVTSDVDVYNVKNEPDGAGHVVGMLSSGSQVQLVGSCQPQSWCQVSGAAVPGGQGWVWGALQL